MRKTLRLSREALAPLADAQLGSVAAGAQEATGTCTTPCWSIYYCPVPTLPLGGCFRETSPCTS